MYVQGTGMIMPHSVILCVCWNQYVRMMWLLLVCIIYNMKIG